MAEKKITTKIQVRRDTTANWLTNKDVVPAASVGQALHITKA